MNQHRLQEHQARKRFGQNFLIDDQIIGQIIQCIAPQPTDTLIEIGPGLGALTERLLDSGAMMTAIEIDHDLAHGLALKHPHLQLVTADVLKVDFAPLLQAGANKIVGNLPYNISTPLLFHLLQYEQHITHMYFMLQKEVVDRLTAQPNTKTYGRLSVSIQYFCEVEPLLLIPPHAFRPQPKVQSAFIRLSPKKEKNLLKSHSLFSQIIAAGFQQRRKTLKNSMSHLLPEIAPEPIIPFLSKRAENLSVEDFVFLSNVLHAALINHSSNS